MSYTNGLLGFRGSLQTCHVHLQDKRENLRKNLDINSWKGQCRIYCQNYYFSLLTLFISFLSLSETKEKKLLSVIILKKQKTCSKFPSSNRNTKFLEVWENEKCCQWEHEPTGECFRSFFEFFQTLTSASTTR